MVGNVVLSVVLLSLFCSFSLYFYSHLDRHGCKAFGAWVFGRHCAWKIGVERTILVMINVCAPFMHTSARCSLLSIICHLVVFCRLFFADTRRKASSLLSQMLDVYNVGTLNGRVCWSLRTKKIGARFRSRWRAKAVNRIDKEARLDCAASKSTWTAFSFCASFSFWLEQGASGVWLFGGNAWHPIAPAIFQVATTRPFYIGCAFPSRFPPPIAPARLDSQRPHP